MDDLFIRPALDLHMKVGCDALSQIENGGEVEVDGKACERGHAACCFLFFVLVGQNALCHNRFTSLVMGLVSQPYSIIPVLRYHGPTTVLQEKATLFIIKEGRKPKERCLTFHHGRRFIMTV